MGEIFVLSLLQSVSIMDERFGNGAKENGPKKYFIIKLGI